MPTALADIRTDRARRYLTQLCRHAGRMGTGIPHSLRRHRDVGTRAQVRSAQCTDTDGVIDFGWGRCTLQATGSALQLRAEADDDVRLEQITTGITERLLRIGRRDHLAVAWSMS
jgi:hypothetical protein